MSASGNRKYVELTIDDVAMMRDLFAVVLVRKYGLQTGQQQDSRIMTALNELVDKARAARPGSSICLARAVERGSK